MKRRRKKKQSPAERRKRRYDPERRRRRYLAEREKKRAEAQRARAAYDRYMRDQKGLPHPEWEIVDPSRSRTIPIFRWVYEKNREHICGLTTSVGARFRILDRN